MVPPETPGTTSAAPMAIPFKEIIKYSSGDRFMGLYKIIELYRVF